MAQHQLEKVFVGKGKHSAEPIVELHEAAELEQRLRVSYFALGKTLYEEGNFAEAASQYKQAIKLDPQSAATHNLLGLALDKQGLLGQAVFEYRKAVNLEPGNSEYQANLGHELALEHSNRTHGEVETVATLH